MKRTVSGLAAALGLSTASLLAGGCQNSMYDENAALHTQNRQLQDAYSNTQAELETRPTEAQLIGLQSELAARDKMIADLQAALNAPKADGSPMLEMGENVDVSMNERGDLTMSVAGDVLFASGSTTINKNAEATLSRIADVLKKDFAGKAIRVEGHTDTDPISKTKKLFADNRDLSLKRAYSVTAFLEGKGVAPEKLETVGHGQYKPRSSTKKDNRRVEIVVVTSA